MKAEEIAAGRSGFMPMSFAPTDGKHVILWLDECIPDVPYVRTGCFIGGSEAEELGYREYAKYGGWMIWHEACTDWYVVDLAAPHGWIALPEPAVRDAISEG